MTYATDVMRPTGLKWQVDDGSGYPDDEGFTFTEMRGRADGRQGRKQATLYVRA